MAIDHYGKIVDTDVYTVTHAVGRLAFPLFAAIIAVRLVIDPGLGRRYLHHLLPWAIASQPVVVLVGREWHELNILFTLALGVLATMALGGAGAMPRWTAAVVLAGVLVLSGTVEYGPLGVAMVPAMVWALSRLGADGLWLAGPLGLAANLTPYWPPVSVAGLAALAAGPALAWSVAAGWRLPRLPRDIFYAYYPAHQLVLYGWRLWLG